MMSRGEVIERGGDADAPALAAGQLMRVFSASASSPRAAPSSSTACDAFQTARRATGRNAGTAAARPAGRRSSRGSARRHGFWNTMPTYRPRRSATAVSSDAPISLRAADHDRRCPSPVPCRRQQTPSGRWAIMDLPDPEEPTRPTRSPSAMPKCAHRRTMGLPYRWRCSDPTYVGAHAASLSAGLVSGSMRVAQRVAEQGADQRYFPGGFNLSNT